MNKKINKIKRINKDYHYPFKLLENYQVNKKKPAKLNHQFFLAGALIKFDFIYIFN